MKILMCTDGSPHSEVTLRYGALIAQADGGEVTILGVAERPPERGAIKRALEEGEAILTSANLKPLLKLREGHPAEEILKETEERDYDLLIAGAKGRWGITRFLLGSTALRLAQYSQIPVLLVKGERSSLKKILICTAGGEQGEADTHIGSHLAHLLQATTTVLHVMSQVPLTSKAIKYLEMPTTELVQQDTPEAIHLRRCLEIMKEIGARGECKIRRGLVVDEILAEAEEGDYDLIVIGAHVAKGFMHFLLDDVTRQVITYIKRPVLVVRSV
jgi:nucleotide-binding universal stress UspA family protein